MRKIERNIYYYEIELKVFKDGDMKISDDFENDCKKMFLSFNDLVFDKNDFTKSKYLKKQNGTYDFIHIDSMDDECITGKLINCDDSGLTYYEKDGEIQFIREVLQEKMVAEVSHFIIFFKERILAFEYNAKSSHAPSLANYITTKNEFYNIKFMNLLNKNKEKRLESIDKIKGFSMTASTKFINKLRAKKSLLFEGFDSVLNLGANTTDIDHQITITVAPMGRINKKAKTPFYSASNLKKEIKLAKKIADEDEKCCFELDVTGINELNEQIRVNYTRDIIVSNIKIEPENIESKNFYDKIKDNYIKIKKEYIE